ncbi:MAG: putative peptidoglycan-binding domain-containing protein [Vicinamibacterales bacterium]
MTVERIVDDILRRELHPTERTWAEARARQHAADRGGWTRGGITASRWGQYRRLGRSATAAELNAITEVEARAFYVAWYVMPFDRYPEPLRILLIDFGVTTSHVTVFKCLQRALRHMGRYPGAIDGVVGPRTRAALAEAEPREVYLRTLEHRARHYIALSHDSYVRGFLRATPNTQLHFLRGWLARCLPFVYEAEP